MEDRNSEEPNSTFLYYAWQQSWRNGMQGSTVHFDGSVPSLSMTSPSNTEGRLSSWDNSGLDYDSGLDGQQGETEGTIPPAPLTNGPSPNESYHQGMITTSGIFNANSYQALLLTQQRREPSSSHQHTTSSSRRSLPIRREEAIDQQGHQDNDYNMREWYSIMPTPLSPEFSHCTSEYNNFVQQQCGHELPPIQSVESISFGSQGSVVQREPHNHQQNQGAWQHILGMRGQMDTQNPDVNHIPVVQPAGVRNSYQDPNHQFHVPSPQYTQHSIGSLQQGQQQGHPLPYVALLSSPQQGVIHDHFPQGTDHLKESTHSHSSSVARRFGNLNINDGHSTSRTGSASYSTHAEDEVSLSEILAIPSRSLSRSERSSSVSQLNDSVESLGLDALFPEQASPHESVRSNISDPDAEILQLNEQDVLGGQGSGSSSRAGNQRYLQRVQSLRPAYQALGLRDPGKKAIALEVFNFVHDQGGRFVEKRWPTDLHVVELSREKAFERIQRALRQKEDE